MIDYELLRAWLTAIPTELAYEFVVGPRQPEYLQADRVGLVTPQPGPGLAMDGLANVPSFEVKLVAREFQAPALRRSAFAIDKALVFGNWPADIWGTRVQWVDRAGGEPSTIPEDGNLQDRVAYSCSYLVHEMPEL